MEVYRLFAQLLEYPTPSLPNQVDETISLLTFVHRQAIPMLDEFRTFLRMTSFDRTEELYTRTFDLQAICHPYVGYHLFGDGNQRGLFMVGLQGRYKLYGFSAGNELPDHLGILLRFASNCSNPEREELVNECIIPAAEKMVAQFEGDRNPYKRVLEALLLFLQKEGRDQPGSAIGSEEIYHGR